MNKSRRLCTKQLCYTTAQEGDLYCSRHLVVKAKTEKRYFVSYAYDEGFGCMEVTVAFFSMAEVTKMICRDYKLENAVILYFRELEEGEGA